jgi:hypothetical protein
LPAKTIVNPIVEDVLDSVFKVKRAHITVNRNTTLENWQKKLSVAANFRNWY